jgi:hypothetical protein
MVSWLREEHKSYCSEGEKRAFLLWLGVRKKRGEGVFI